MFEPAFFERKAESFPLLVLSAVFCGIKRVIYETALREQRIPSQDSGYTV